MAKSSSASPARRRAADWLTAAVEVQIARRPLLVQSRALWHLLRTQRTEWAWLIPLLVLVLLRSYRRERIRLLRASVVK